MIKKFLSIVAFALLSFMPVEAAETFVGFAKGDVLLCKQNDKFTVCVEDNANSAVKLAAKNLAADFAKVLDADVTISANADDCRIIAGTIGESKVINKLAKEGAFDAKQLSGKTEKYILTVADGKVVIAGSDRRGTVYGIYELSRQMGVSPWYYWMDTPIRKQQSLYINKGVYTDGEPAVRYRGIFLNDEAPCLTTWVKNTFGTRYGDHRFYEKVFELVLRLKGNYIWPAMWGWAFYDDDPLNGKTANDMGVMIGTSHHEPMCRPQQEWHRFRGTDKGTPAGNQKWNYATNKAQLDRFWYAGVERNKDTEDIITIGMRGDGDEAMSEDRNVKLLENIVANQRKLISKARSKAAKEVPQMWALYKEVLDYYDDGMRVPDDVIMLLCDDNWGDVRRVPTAKELKRKGGWGLYYHVDYVGAPRNSKTLNVTPIPNMWEQLRLAYDYGINKLWILNVGDLKPMEYPIQLFMDMAWKCPEMPTMETLQAHTRDFCQSIFGEKEAAEAARILELCCKLNGRCTPEMLDAKTLNLESGEWEQVINEYKTLEIAALEQSARLDCAARDAYFQLILFPIQLMSNLYQMYYAQAMNNALHEQGDAAQNEWADECEHCFNRDAQLMRQYNKDIAGGKWDGMMIQKHIGYKIWNDDFPHDMMPTVYRMDNVQNIFDEAGRGYIAMEAQHFAQKQDAQNAKWTEIKGIGRTLGGMELMPQTAAVAGASLDYAFTTTSKEQKVKVHIITKSTLDFLNKGGMTYTVAIDGVTPATVNFNCDMNEAPENIYETYYPAVARRVIEKVVELPISEASLHTLRFVPNDPGILLEKIIIDFGGYKPQFLFGKESKRK